MTIKGTIDELDPAMITFLKDHPMARASIYGMMSTAAALKDDPKMVKWYAPVQEVIDRNPYDHQAIDRAKEKLWRFRDVIHSF